MLSICLITRDAEALLERALRSVAGLNAEVIVGDTGSKDGTLALAQRLGAKTCVVPWQKDFAAAQNLTLGQATGDWVLWLNPDEELLAQGLDQMEGLLAWPEALAYALRVQQVMNPEQAEQSTEVILPRLFRRRPDITFIGRLHPHFAVPLETLARRENMRIYQADLIVRSHAYLSVLTEDKLRWVMSLLELELQDRPGQLHYLIEYGRNLLRLNDPKGHVILAEAAEQVLAASEAPQAPSATVASLLEYLLTVSPEQARSRLIPQQAEELALRWFGQSPPLLWQLASRAQRAGNFRGAAELLEKCIHLGHTGTYDHSAGFDHALMGEPAFLNLGHCYVRLGNLERAEWCFRQVLDHPKLGTQAREAYEWVRGKRQEG